MNALTKPIEAEIVQTDATTMMAVIERASRDPATNVDALERLMGLYERITDRNAKAEYTSALADMQPKLPTITERGRIIIPGKNGAEDSIIPFAKFEDMQEAIRLILHDHGFALSYRTGSAADGKIEVTGVLAHKGGHQEQTTLALPHDSSGSKNAVQAVGSSVTYGKRYVTQALLNLTSRGEDDDGKRGGDPGGLSEEQTDRLREEIEAAGGDLKKFCAFFKISKLADLPEARLAEAASMLQRKAAR